MKVCVTLDSLTQRPTVLVLEANSFQDEQVLAFLWKVIRRNGTLLTKDEMGNKETANFTKAKEIGP